MGLGEMVHQLRHWLLLQKMWVRFPAPTWMARNCNSSPGDGGSAFLAFEGTAWTWYLDIHACKIPIYMKRIKTALLLLLGTSLSSEFSACVV